MNAAGLDGGQVRRAHAFWLLVRDGLETFSSVEQQDVARPRHRLATIYLGLTTLPPVV